MKIKRDFTYRTAEQSRRPGYLKSRFDAIRRQLKDDDEKLQKQWEKVVKPLQRVAK